MKDQTHKLTKEFIEAFEEVFDKDWAYTKEMLGIRNQTAQQKAHDKAMGLEVIDIVADDGTFINPRVADETEDWGHRGNLLRLYRELKKVL